MKKQELMLGENLQRKDDVQPVIEPEIIETEVVETDDVEKEGQGSRRPVTWETDFQRYFGVSPFPLSAEKIAFLVQRIDWEGPRLMGAYYPSTLQTECGLLLPQPVYGFLGLAISRHPGNVGTKHRFFPVCRVRKNPVDLQDGRNGRC